MPVPYPVYSKESLDAGALRIRDAATEANIPAALVLVVRSHQSGKFHYPVAFEGKPELRISNAVIFHDGDPFVARTTRGVHYLFDIHVKSTESASSGFLVVARGYEPRYFNAPSKADSRASLTWDLDPASNANACDGIRAQIIGNVVEIPGTGGMTAVVHLSKSEERKALDFLSGNTNQITVAHDPRMSAAR